MVSFSHKECINLPKNSLQKEMYLNSIFTVTKQLTNNLVPTATVFSLNFSSAGKGPFMGSKAKKYATEVHFSGERG